MRKISIMRSVADRSLDSRRRSTVKVVTAGIAVKDGNKLL
jgi:hypothetical protein